MLTLPIKKKWFDMILSGEKPEEYRSLTPYYVSRFGKYKTGSIETCLLRNGYSSTSPTLEIKYTLEIGQGKKEWGAEIGVNYFKLKIIERKLVPQ